MTISDGTNSFNHATAVIKKYVSVPSITFNPDLSLKIGTDNLTSFAVSGNCIDAEDTNTITFSHGEIVGTAPVCSESAFSATLDFTGVDEGAIAFVATITDPLGNSSTTSLTLNKDLVAPTLALASDLPRIVNSNNEASFGVSGTCTNAEPSDTITFSHGEIVGISPSCSDGTFSATLDLQAVAEGNFNFTATINDRVYSYTTQAVVIEKNAIPPVIAFDDTVSAAINSENEASFALSGTCTNAESADTITFSHGEIVGDSPSCSDGTFSATVDFSGLADGTINFGGTITNDKGSSSSTYLLLAKGEAGSCVSTGSGTLTSPMTICNYQGLKNIANGLDKHYILESDINAINSWSEGAADCTPYDGTTIAASNPCGGMTPLGVFTGSLDGRDHLISHLYINASVNEKVGLFAETNNATIKNLHLRSVRVKNTGNETGALVGRAAGQNFHILFDNCSVTGEIAGNNTIGGLFGAVHNSFVIVNSYADITVQGNDYVGGLFGGGGPYISNSYAKGEVTGNSYVGGLFGEDAFVSTRRSYANVAVTLNGHTGGGLAGLINNAKIYNSYSVGAVSGSGSSIGGLVGKIDDEEDSNVPFVVNSFWDTQTSGQSTSAISFIQSVSTTGGLTTAQMQVACTAGSTAGICALGGGFYFQSGHYPVLKRCLSNCHLDNPVHSERPVGGQDFFFVTIGTSSDILAAVASSYEVSGYCSEEGEAVTLVLTDSDSATASPSTAPSCNRGQWTATVDASALGDGSVSIDATHSDGDGGSASATTVSVTKSTET